MFELMNSQMPTHKGCCICFEFVPVEDLWQDLDGSRWDMCKPCGAYELICGLLSGMGYEREQILEIFKDLTRYFTPATM